MEVSMHVLWSRREGFLTFQLLLQNARYLAYVMIVPVSHALKLMKFSVLIQKPYAQETTSAQMQSLLGFPDCFVILNDRDCKNQA